MSSELVDRIQKAEATLALMGFQWDEGLKQYVTGPNKVYAVGTAANNPTTIGECRIVDGPLGPYPLAGERYFYKCMFVDGCHEPAAMFVTEPGRSSVPMCIEHAEKKE
jgi:hypothetical protein